MLARIGVRCRDDCYQAFPMTRAYVPLVTGRLFSAGRANELSVFDGLRVLSMLWVVLGHTLAVQVRFLRSCCSCYGDQVVLPWLAVVVVAARGVSSYQLLVMCRNDVGVDFPFCVVHFGGSISWQSASPVKNGLGIWGSHSPRSPLSVFLLPLLCRPYRMYASLSRVSVIVERLATGFCHVSAASPSFSPHPLPYCIVTFRLCLAYVDQKAVCGPLGCFSVFLVLGPCLVLSRPCSADASPFTVLWSSRSRASCFVHRNT